MLNFVPAAIVALVAVVIAWWDWILTLRRGYGIPAFKYVDLVVWVSYALFFVGCFAYLI